MYRNNPLHTGVATDVVAPPLVLKWKQTFGDDVVSSPAVVGSRVYVGSVDGSLYALDSATGNIVWAFKEVAPSPNPTAAWRASPTVATIGGQTVIFAGNDNNRTYAVRDDGATATKLWDYADGATMRVVSSPVVTSVAGTQVVIFGSKIGKLYALVASTGGLYGGWAVNPFSPGGVFYSSPAILGQTIFIGNNDGNLYAVNLGNGVQLWAYAAAGPIFSSPAVADVIVAGVLRNLVFFGSEGAAPNLYAVDAASGVFQWTFTVGNAVDSSPAIADIPNPPPVCAPGPTRAVIFGSDDNNLYAVRAADGTPCWTFPSTGAQPFRSSPTVSGQIVYVGSDDNNVYAVDMNTGTWRWSYPALGPVGDATVAPNPVVSGTRLYVGSKDNSLYAFEALTVTVSTTQVVTVSTTTTTATISTGTTQTQTQATTLFTTLISSTWVTSVIPPSPVPGFPIESILAGILAGLAALSFLRRKRRQEARGSGD